METMGLGPSKAASSIQSSGTDSSADPNQTHLPPPAESSFSSRASQRPMWATGPKESMPVTQVTPPATPPAPAEVDNGRKTGDSLPVEPHGTETIDPPALQRTLSTVSDILREATMDAVPDGGEGMRNVGANHEKASAMATDQPDVGNATSTITNSDKDKTNVNTVQSADEPEVQYSFHTDSLDYASMPNEGTIAPLPNMKRSGHMEYSRQLSITPEPEQDAPVTAPTKQTPSSARTEIFDLTGDNDEEDDVAAKQTTSALTSAPQTLSTTTKAAVSSDAGVTIPSDVRPALAVLGQMDPTALEAAVKTGMPAINTLVKNNLATILGKLDADLRQQDRMIASGQPNDKLAVYNKLSSVIRYAQEHLELHVPGGSSVPTNSANPVARATAAPPAVRTAAPVRPLSAQHAVQPTPLHGAPVQPPQSTRTASNLQQQQQVADQAATVRQQQRQQVESRQSYSQIQVPRHAEPSAHFAPPVQQSRVPDQRNNLNLIQQPQQRSYQPQTLEALPHVDTASNTRYNDAAPEQPASTASTPTVSQLHEVAHRQWSAGMDQVAMHSQAAWIISLGTKETYDKHLYKIALDIEKDRDLQKKKTENAEAAVARMSQQVRDQATRMTEKEQVLQQEISNIRKQFEACATRENRLSAEVDRLTTLNKRHHSSHEAMAAQLEKVTAQAGGREIAAMKAVHEAEIKQLKETQASLLRNNIIKMTQLQTEKDDAAASARTRMDADAERLRMLENKQSALKVQHKSAQVKWNEEKAEFQKQVSVLTRELAEKDHGVQASLASLQKDLAKTEARLAAKTAERTNLDEVYENALAEMEESHKAEVEQAREEIKAEMTELREKVRAMEEKVQAAESEAKQARSRLQEVETTAKAAEAESKTVERTAEVVQALKEKVDVLEKEKDRLSALIESNKRSNSEKDDTIQTLEARLNTEGETRMAEKKRERTVEGEKRKLEETNMRLNKELSQLRTKIAELAEKKAAEQPARDRTPLAGLLASRVLSPESRSSVGSPSHKTQKVSLASINNAAASSKPPVSSAVGSSFSREVASTSTSTKRQRSPALQTEPLFLRNDEGDSPVAKRSRLLPAEIRVKQEKNTSRSSTPIQELSVPSEEWVASHTHVLVTKVGSNDFCCRVCHVDAKKLASKDPKICPPGLSKDEADRRAAKHVKPIDRQTPLAGVSDLKDEASMARLVKHMRETHASTLIRLKEKREKEGKD